VNALTSICLAIALAAGATSAFAHGDAAKAGKPTAVRKEQKPWGIAGDPGRAKRTITVAMTDKMRFTPDRIEVRQGDTLKFLLKNNGRLMHEFVIGTRQELEEHAALMVKFPNMDHDEPYMAHVAPGKTGQIVWTFNQAGEFEFACLIAGHFQAGMIGKITVIATK